MNNIRGKETSLTLFKDYAYTPLCYTEETLRQSVVDYALPATIGKSKRETRLATGTKIEGCFVTRLDVDSVLPVFELVSEDAENFTLLADRVFSKQIFKNLNVQSFELRAENKNPFYFHIDVKETRNSAVEKFNHLTPVVKWDNTEERISEKGWENEDGSVGRDSSTSLRSAQNDNLFTGGQKRTFFYDGHSILVAKQNGIVRLPLVHRFELAGDFSENRRFSFTLCYALNDGLYPELSNIEKIVIPISNRNGMYLELHNLKPTDDRTNIQTSDEVLIRQKFWVRGEICFVVRNKNRYLRIIL